MVIASRNRCEAVLGVIERIAVLPERPSIILVDDGSEDDTAPRTRESFPDVRVLRLERSRGAAAARNAGVEAAETPIVAFADDDSWWEPRALSRIAQAFSHHPRVGAVAGRILVGDDQRLDPTCAAMAASPLPSHGLPGPRILGFVACGAAVRRQAFLEVGGFPERYSIGGEEEPLALSLAAAGWDIVYLHDAVAHHMPGGVTRDVAMRERRLLRNDLWTAWTHRRTRGALGRTFELIRGADTGAKREGVVAAAAALPEVIRRRRPVPRAVETERHLVEGRPAKWIASVARNRTRQAAVSVVAHHAARERMGTSQRVAVVVITHNRCRELISNLERLTALPEAPPIIVVDNASTDGTAHEVGARYPDIELIALADNVGAVGRNIAVERLSHPYIAFADDDTWWEPGSLAGAVEFLDRHDHIAVVTARIVVEPEGGDDPVVADMADSPLTDGGFLPGRPLVSFLAGASVVRRDAFTQVGGFDPRLRIGGEEELMAADLLAAGWQLRYLPELTVHHRASLVRDPHRRRADGLRNTLWFTWLRRPLLRAARRSAAILRAAPADRVTARAVAEAVGGIPWVVRERHRLPRAVERQLRAVERVQLDSPARRYVS